MAFRGIDIRETGDRIVFRALLQDSDGALVASGDTYLYLYELQSDGTLFSYDWDDNTFKSTDLTTETQAMTHRTGDNGGTNTGLWTYALTTLTDFVAGSIYFARVYNSGASPTDQVREFQFGSGVLADVKLIEGSDATDQIRDAVVDDATRITAIALNTLSGHDPGATLAKAGDEMDLVDAPNGTAIAAIWAEAMSDLAAVPGADASALDALNWLFELARNKLTETVDTQTLYKDDGSTPLATSTTSDDGTTATRGEFS